MSTDMGADGAVEFPAGIFVHWCESCGHEELLDSRDAYRAGWDFPPHMGAWGVLSPRTCPNCSIKDTSWWAITVDHRDIDEMTAQERKAVGRILDELPADSGYDWAELDGPSSLD